MVKAKINSGACGFETTVQAEAGPDYLAGVKITSGCQHINKMAEKLGTLNVMSELFKKGESQVLAAAKEILPHLTCPVPIGILKAIEASAGMALPKDVTITLAKGE
ncbi:hypothetical protein Tfer_2933 [Thermincola ferriacetica]|uniref:Uncharacterized protein n=1 Tax=Thermincola ferriacetica TaxID=281456 RepID=A0A0L6VZG9_9FIRM|nr:hypothetical protein [Thermincola ferriacetica]KNZ68538.1 hypothetical protein Tfer_2933 [Thermincola ferriacetica]